MGNVKKEKKGGKRGGRYMMSASPPTSPERVPASIPLFICVGLGMSGDKVYQN
jgi:hypothetical protein